MQSGDAGQSVPAGRSVIVIDPKYQLISEIAERIPAHRQDDIIIVDTASSAPVGINPLAYQNHQNPALIVDAIYNVFYALWRENFGIRTQDVLTAALLTLVKTKGSSLLWLPPLLTNDAFRAQVTANINDPIGLDPFWEGFAAMNKAEQRQEVAPVLNKVRQFLLRPGLRNILGQSNPKFSLSDVFTDPKVVLIPLNKGLIGEESAKLLGSLIVGLIWTLALGRAAIPERQRKLVHLYIDELQDYISAFGDSFSSALAQARGLGLGICMAHQFREQIPAPILAGIDANARSKIAFTLDVSDAKAMAAMAPNLEPEDFQSLPTYHIYSSFRSGGRSTGWVSGVTLPMTKPICNEAALRRKVAARYGKPVREVEKEYLDLMSKFRTEIKPDIAGQQIGKRPK